MGEKLFADFNNISDKVDGIYLQAISDYHLVDSLEAPCRNPYSEKEAAYLFYQKCWIDSIQWHLEDKIRSDDISPSHALKLKRRIDFYNQARTDIVEAIDALLLQEFKSVEVMADARVNTESPAWALDRLSILALKIYHMNIEVEREDADAEHVRRCSGKLQILLEQRSTLLTSINELFQDIYRGFKYMKVYRQMKMYNDAALNPVLYNRGK